MTAPERVWAAINLKEVDRVPVGLPLSWFTARHAGIAMSDFATDCEANAGAAVKTFQDLGGFDLVPLLGFSPVLMGAMMPMSQKFPGKELPPDSIVQYHEQEIMKADEYDIVIRQGWRYYEKEYIFPRAHPEFSGPSGEARLREIRREEQKAAARVRPVFADSVIFEGAMAMPPFETLSMARSFGPFLLDLFRRPAKVLAAMDTMLAEILDEVSLNLKTRRKTFGNCAISRSASTFISLPQFEKFVFPYVKQFADLFMANNLAMVFHLDQAWLKFLPLFRKLPEGRYVLELDGATDIFTAKRIVGDRMCLMGDVPARMFKLGTAREVEQYCRKLIDNVGRGSGFILSCG
jgi:hypothetical protein